MAFGLAGFFYPNDPAENANRQSRPVRTPSFMPRPLDIWSLHMKWNNTDWDTLSPGYVGMWASVLHLGHIIQTGKKGAPSPLANARMAPADPFRNIRDRGT